MAGKLLLDEHTVVLASGGGRGITAQCVIKLAESAHSRFILLGRSSLEDPKGWLARTSGIDEESELKRYILQGLQANPEAPSPERQKATPQRVQQIYQQVSAQREIQRTLHAIQQAGGQAEYISVDVTDRQALHQKLAGPIQRLGLVTGILHGAGSLADKRIEKKTGQDFDRVYSPKVDGLESLLDCVSMDRLRFLVLFSSVVGVFGNVGQADYAMANETLNKTAYLIKRDHPNCRVISINWGPWDSGMVNPSLMKVFIEKNIQLIPGEVGARLLVEELSASQDAEVVQVVIGSPPPRTPEEEEAPAPGATGCQYQIQRRLTLEANPFLIDHQIGKHPVLPATCAASWVINACEQLCPGYTFFSIENYQVLKGIVFDDSLAKEYILDLKETVGQYPHSIAFEALIWSEDTPGKRLYHYRLEVTLLRQGQTPSPPILSLPQSLQSVLPVAQGVDLYRDGTLFHGPSFQGVREVLSITAQKLVMRCNLSPVEDRQQGQFPVQTSNPYLYDAIVQSLLIWTQHHHQSPCLPSRLSRLEQYRPIPFGETVYATMEVSQETETAVTGNITVQDERGQVCLRFIELEGTISKQLSRFFKR